ncbi:MAG: LysR family transcriptional regulator, partial [Rhizobiales bacterium]|nr:LysR family transcriptional regulator [Hyphomicrobiales bacterium]
VLVAVEAGLGLSLLPRNATAGYHVRQYAPFGIEPPMVVSIYAWESTGAISDLVERMGTVLAARCAPPT